MLFKRAGSPFWYVRFRDASGGRVKRSTGTTDRREAQELEGKWRLEARQQRLWGTQPRYTFDELMLRYLKETRSIKRSAEADAWYAKSLHRFFSGRVLLEVRRQPVIIAQVLGHSTLRMSERYSHLAPANARAAVETLVGVPKPVPSAPAVEVAST